MKLNNVSKIKKRVINEAIKMWKNNRTGTYKERIELGKALRKLGWTRATGAGVYKICYYKHSIAIKYAANPKNEESNNEVDREVQQWKCVPREFKRHLPKIYLYKNGLLVQDKVMNNDCSWYCADAKHVAKKFGCVYDWRQNHGHTLKGTVKFFDWVYKRDYKRINNFEIKLTEK